MSQAIDLEDENHTLKEQITLMKIQQRKEKKAAAQEKFTEICEYISKVPTGKNVHALDDFVFEKKAHINNLLEIARHINIDDGTLSWNKISDIINGMFKVGPCEVVVWYEKKEITLEQFKKFVKNYFDNIPRQLSLKSGVQNDLCDQVRELWSRTISLSVLENHRDPAILSLLADMICENYLTNGNQSLGGKINRTFIRYVSLIGPHVSGLDY